MQSIKIHGCTWERWCSLTNIDFVRHTYECIDLFFINNPEQSKYLPSTGDASLSPGFQTFCVFASSTSQSGNRFLGSGGSVGWGGNAELDSCRANQSVEVWGVMVASQAIKSWHPSPGDLGVGLRPGRERVLLIYEPLCSLVNKNKTAGVITNSLLTGSIIYEQWGATGPWFLWYPNQAKAGMMWWRPCPRHTCCLSYSGPMRCPLGAGPKGLRGRCREMEKADHRNTCSCTDGILHMNLTILVCACVRVCTRAWMHTCMHVLICIDSLSTSKGNQQYTYIAHMIYFFPKRATVANRLRIQRTLK